MEIKKIYHNQFVIFWLLSYNYISFFMIIVGGLTRLTESGLSITEWELFKGIFPPLTMKLGYHILICIKKFLNSNLFIH